MISVCEKRFQPKCELVWHGENTQLGLLTLYNTLTILLNYFLVVIGHNSVFLCLRVILALEKPIVQEACAAFRQKQLITFVSLQI